MYFDMDDSYMGNMLRLTLQMSISMAVTAGFTTFLNGMARGFDIIAAEAVLREKEQNKSNEIKLISVLPYKDQDVRWGKKWRDRHDAILRKADHIETLNVGYVTGCYYERNRFLVDNSDMLIALLNDEKSGTSYTVNLAVKAGVRVINLIPFLEAQDPMRRVCVD